jgi:hypothetical protein
MNYGVMKGSQKTKGAFMLNAQRANVPSSSTIRSKKVINEDDDTVVFQPVEEVVRTGIFIDQNMRHKIKAKPILSYNPL